MKSVVGTNKEIGIIPVVPKAVVHQVISLGVYAPMTYMP